MGDNINRWLQSVRPRTAADDDWSDTREADELLAAVHRTVASGDQRRIGKASAGRSDTRQRFALGRRVSGAGAALACVVAVFVMSTVGGSNDVPPPASVAPRIPTIAQGMRPAAFLLHNYSSCAELLAGLRSHTAASVTRSGLPGQPLRYAAYDLAGLHSTVGATKMLQATGGVGGISTTNVQEVGVDEPDIVKTDGGRVVTITDGVLRVVDVATRQITGSLDLTLYDGWQDAQLLVDGDHALVILGGTFDSYLGARFAPASLARSNARSTYLFLDLAGTPKVTGSMRASGSYVDARQIGSTVRLVVSSTPSITFPDRRVRGHASVVANRHLVRTSPLSAWLPSYSITYGAGTTGYRVPCSQVSHPRRYTGASMLTIYTLDLAHLGSGPEPVSVAADGDTVYATSSSLYVASNPDWYCCTTGERPQRTELHRFDITGDARPTYLGSASVRGRLLSQYSISDYDGSLRIATTTGRVDSAGQSNDLYVLNSDTLQVTGQVTGLGAGERIYAVRFLGPIAYVVTFRETDPLYVIDLSDPTAPKVAGELKLTGYSDYLHDAGDGRVIGVGQEASDQGRVAGLQISLFNVSNPEEPIRTGHVVRPGDRGETTLDPHAFLYWQPTGLIVTPIDSWARGESGKVLVLTVSGDSLKLVGALANPHTSGSTDDGLGIQRSLYVNGSLWTLSGSGIQVSNPSTLDRQAWITFG